MGMLVNGNWQCQDLKDFIRNGSKVRFTSGFYDEIKKDGSSQFNPEKGRYALYFNFTCPWSHRATITRELKGLTDAIDAVLLEPSMGKESWWFGDNNEYKDPAIDATYLHELYTATDANFTGRVSIPVLWDKDLCRIVNNDSAMIARMLNSEFDEFAIRPNVDFYPNHKRDEVDQLNLLIASKLNDGVYRCLLAKKQEDYEKAFDSIFQTLDYLEERLATQRYLVTHQPTEPDWRLFAFLIRFDIVYYSLYKCNLKRISDYPNLSSYTRDLYQIPGVLKTVNLETIKIGYYKTVSPGGTVPKGPYIDFLAPHKRNTLR